MLINYNNEVIEIHYLPPTHRQKWMQLLTEREFWSEYNALDSEIKHLQDISMEMLQFYLNQRKRR